MNEFTVNQLIKLLILFFKREMSDSTSITKRFNLLQKKFDKVDEETFTIVHEPLRDILSKSYRSCANRNRYVNYDEFTSWMNRIISMSNDIIDVS